MLSGFIALRYLSLPLLAGLPADLLQLDQTNWVPTWCKVSVAAAAAAAAGAEGSGGVEGGRFGFAFVRP